MKLISIKCLSNSKTTLEMNELHFESENLAAKIVVDYSSTAVSDWNKVVKCFMANGSSKTFNLNTDPIVEALIDNSVTVAGNMTIQVYAIASGEPNAMKVMFEERIVPFKGITKDGDPAAEHPDLIDEIFLDITNLENTKSDKTYVDTELAKKVDKVTGKSLIDDAEIIRLASVDNYDDTAVQQAITDLDTEKVDKVAGQGLSDQNYTLAEKQKLVDVEAGAQVNQVNSVAGKTGDVTLVKTDVGLGNVDNTSDLNKPVSTAQQTAIDTKVDKLMATNIVTNGDFSNGITGWSARSLTTILLEVDGLKCVATATNSSAGVSRVIVPEIGSVFYTRARVKSDVSAPCVLFGTSMGYTTSGNTVANQWVNLSSRGTFIADNSYRVYQSLLINESFIVNHILLINLTQLFGAGKEPTKEQMDRLLSIYPNSWFDGTKEIINVKQMFEEKVDRLMATNLVTNGDFSQGDDWAFNGNPNTITITDKIVINGTATDSTGRIKVVNLPTGNIYYLRFKAGYTSGTKPEIRETLIGAVGTNTTLVWNNGENGYRLTARANGVQLYVRQGIGETYNNVSFDNFLVIDLTAIFGAGKEPSALEMDNLLANFPNSWFNGTQELINYKELLLDVNGKANKTQEAWITATLLNGATGSLQYRKNEFGVVEFRGAITAISTSPFAQLPSGYRPPASTHLICSGAGASTFVRLLFTSGGDLSPHVGGVGIYFYDLRMVT